MDKWEGVTWLPYMTFCLLKLFFITAADQRLHYTFPPWTTFFLTFIFLSQMAIFVLRPWANLHSGQGGSWTTLGFWDFGILI
jgi:hypothetical protein